MNLWWVCVKAVVELLFAAAGYRVRVRNNDTRDGRRRRHVESLQRRQRKVPMMGCNVLSKTSSSILKTRPPCQLTRQATEKHTPASQVCPIQVRRFRCILGFGRPLKGRSGWVAEHLFWIWSSLSYFNQCLVLSFSLSQVPCHITSYLTLRSVFHLSALSPEHCDGPNWC